MGIFSILSRNSARGARTRRPEDRVPCPLGFRGMITHDPARCMGCGTCAYVCSPSAITLDETDPRFIEWAYFAGRCTFCGRCVEYCATQALRFEPESPVVTGDQSQHRLAHQVFYKPCARCGHPIIPVPLQTLQAVYGGSLPEDLVAHQRLCERCRGKAAARRLKGMAGGSENE
jgi:hydrogenase-4 component H